MHISFSDLDFVFYFKASEVSQNEKQTRSADFVSSCLIEFELLRIAT